jgi:N-methylhydantoinase B
VYGGGNGALGATWVFHPDYLNVVQRKDLIGTEGEVYSGATPVAGMLDPQTKTVDPDGEYFYFASTPVWHTRPNAVFRYLTNGGGGWGNPLERSPERVCKDVRDEYVSIEGAYTDYGVVITGDPHGDPEGLRIDAEATAKRRAEMAGK